MLQPLTIGMLSNKPGAASLCGIVPCWSLVHYLVQASTVLMLELSLLTDHMPYLVLIIPPFQSW